MPYTMPPEKQAQVKKAYRQLQLTIFTGKNSAFLAPLLCSLNIKFTDGSDFGRDPERFYMGTTGDTIWINPDKLLTMKLKDASFILEHELWHIARLHIQRRGDKDPQTWNQACDYVINNDMIRDGSSCGIPGLVNPDYLDKSEEDVYGDICKPRKQAKNKGNGSDPAEVPPSDKSGEDYGNSDSDNPVGNDLLPATKEQIENALGNVIKARQQALLSGGLQPGTTAGDLCKVWDKFLEPELPWENILHSLMKDLLPKTQLSWKRRNRRYMNIHMPSMVAGKDRLAHLIYAIDTSGSVSEEQLNRINSEIRYVHDRLKPKKLTVIQFDEDLQNVQTFTDKDKYEKVELHGGGGTSYWPVKHFVDNCEGKVNGLIVFTDLYCDPMAPLANPNIPVFWVGVATDKTEKDIPFGHFIPVRV